MTPEEYEILFGEPPPAEPTPSPPPEHVVDPAEDGPFTFNLTTEEPSSPEPSAPDTAPYEPVVIASLNPSRDEQLWQQVASLEARAKRTATTRTLKRRVLAPAALIGAVVLAVTFIGNDDDTVDVAIEATTTTDVEQTTTVPTTTAPTTESSTTAPTTTTPTTTTIAVEVLGAVEDRELADVFVQLAEADVVASFVGVADFARDSYTGGAWPDSDGDCQSDRDEVLIDESLDDPVLDESGCRVISGRWLDPYDGTEYTSADDLTISHVVPLLAAHQAGGSAWSPTEMRAFATDTEFPATLAAVGTELHGLKGSQGPDLWRPPLESAWCRYGVDWVSIKHRWSLAFTESEVIALSEMLDTCDPLAEIDISNG